MPEAINCDEREVFFALAQMLKRMSECNSVSC